MLESFTLNPVSNTDQYNQSIHADTSHSTAQLWPPTPSPESLLDESKTVVGKSEMVLKQVSEEFPSATFSHITINFIIFLAVENQ